MWEGGHVLFCSVHLEYILRIKLVQKVRRVAVTMAAHNHQCHKWCQEDGGEYTDGHDHHRLHACGDDERGLSKDACLEFGVAKARRFWGNKYKKTCVSYQNNNFLITTTLI